MGGIREFFKPLSKCVLAMLEVKIKVLWNPMGAQIQNSGGSSLSLVLGTIVRKSTVKEGRLLQLEM